MTLKRTVIFAVLLIGLAGVVMILSSYSAASRKVPRFVPGAPADAITNLANSASYAWGEAVPFQAGRVWMWSPSSPTNVHTYWVNLADRTVVGELFNAGAEFSNQDQTKLLCAGRSSLLPTMKQRLANWLDRLTGGKIKPRLNRDEAFWILDLRNNRAKRIGNLSQFPGTGSRWQPAPGFRFGYNIPSTSSGGDFFICDLEQERMTRMQFPGAIQGWWDERHLLMQEKLHNFLLFDVETQATNTLLTATQLQDFLRQSGLPDALDQLRAEPTWTGDGFSFYLSSKTNGIRSVAPVLRLAPGRTATNLASTIVRLPELEIFHRSFQFEWLGHLNASGTLYVFPGESGQPGSGGDGSVHLRVVQTGEIRTLNQSTNSNQYTLPRFFGDRIIYTKSRQPWSIDVNGSNNFRLFELPTGSSRAR